MFIATDGVSEGVPADVKAAAETFAETVAAGGAGAPPRTESGLAGAPMPAAGGGAAATLDRWDIQAHQYKTAAEVKTGILVGLFSGRSAMVKSGVVQEAKRYKVQETSKKNRIEFGCAVRLVVATNETEAKVKLTIPNIAAGAQLSQFEARVALSVVGFTGNLGDMLPAPGELNVETLPEYLTAFRKIQAYVFGREGAAFLAPTLLGYGKLD